jgi:hypothetical protein
MEERDGSYTLNYKPYELAVSMDYSIYIKETSLVAIFFNKCSALLLISSIWFISHRALTNRFPNRTSLKQLNHFDMMRVLMPQDATNIIFNLYFKI